MSILKLFIISLLITSATLPALSPFTGNDTKNANINVIVDNDMSTIAARGGGGRGGHRPGGGFRGGGFRGGGFRGGGYGGGYYGNGFYGGGYYGYPYSTFLLYPGFYGYSYAPYYQPRGYQFNFVDDGFHY